MMVVITNASGGGQLACQETIEILDNRTLRPEDDLNIVLSEQVYSHLSHAAADNRLSILFGDKRRDDTGSMGRRGNVLRIPDLGALTVQ